MESHRLMQSLNASFEVLDDPRRRALHDQWIAAQERSIFRPLRNWFAAALGAAHRGGSPRPFREYDQSRWGDLVSGWIAPACVVAFLVWGFTTVRHSVAHSAAANSPLATNPAKSSSAPAYQRPVVAPNGQPWPSGPGELAGYSAILTDGKSEVTVDNTRNDTDVYARLVSLRGGAATTARHFYIPAHRSYQCQHVQAGTYEVWYEDLRTGSVKHSEAFTLTETRDEQVVNYSVMRIILFKMSEGLGSTQRVAGELY